MYSLLRKKYILEKQFLENKIAMSWQNQQQYYPLYKELGRVSFPLFSTKSITKFYHHTKAHTSGACLIHAVISNAIIALILPSTYKGFIDCARSVSTSGPCSCCFPCQGPPSLFHLEAPTSPDSFRSLLKCHLLTLFKNLPSFHSP